MKNVYALLLLILIVCELPCCAQGFSSYPQQQNDMQRMLDFVNSAAGRWPTAQAPPAPQYSKARPSRRDLMLEGGSLMSPGLSTEMARQNPAVNNGATSTAYSNLQTAENEATTASNYADQARCNSDSTALRHFC